MKAHTYDSYIIHQQGSEPASGDRVENCENAEITIAGSDGKKRTFEVRNGIIKREIRGIPLAQTIVAVVFGIMLVVTIVFFIMWWTMR